jgi:hypothetical protein
MELEAKQSGVIDKILVDAGTTVAVNVPIAMLGAVIPAGWLHLPGDSPHKACKFASYCRANNLGFLTLGDKRPISRRKSALRFPGDLADLRRGLLEAIQLGFSNSRRVTVRPGAFDKHMVNPTIACLCYPAAA